MKIDDVTLKGLPQDMIDFKDEVLTLLNNGRYQAIVVGTAPGWTARNGEFVFFSSANITRTYFYNNNQWSFLQYDNAGGPTVVNVSNNVTTVSNTLLNVSNNLVSVSNNVVTGSTTLLNVSNNLVSVSNNVVTGSTTLLNVSNNLVTASNNIGNLIAQVTNGIIKSWVSFFANPAGPTIHDSNGVTSVTRNAAGDYTLTFSFNYLNTGYTLSLVGARSGDSTQITQGLAFVVTSRLVGSVRFFAERALSEALVDVDPCMAMVTGDV